MILDNHIPLERRDDVSTRSPSLQCSTWNIENLRSDEPQKSEGARRPIKRECERKFLHDLTSCRDELKRLSPVKEDPTGRGENSRCGFKNHFLLESPRRQKIVFRFYIVPIFNFAHDDWSIGTYQQADN